jgi:7-carboxy-7-deazaguanine synthase
MSYAVKEMYLTFQGEGALTGAPAVFVRFAGCNLWSGREQDRATAVCKFCDTDFVGTEGTGGGKFRTAGALAAAAKKLWNGDAGATPLVVCTGGEPLLQLDGALVGAFHREGFKIAVETNGTIKAPKGIDWLTVSPKAAAPLRQKSGDELKLVYPQGENRPQAFERLRFKVFSLQPKDGPELAENVGKALAFCARRPRWRLSLQTHKIWEIP